MNPLELDFHQVMVSICRPSEAEANYNPTAFKGMIAQSGGLQAARGLLATEKSEGFTRLNQENPLDLTLEAVLVGNSQSHPLFETWEIEQARQRQEAYGYHV